MNTQRCAWSVHDSRMQLYHDEEWGVPVRESRMLWEMLMLECFQAGLSWQTILNRRQAFQQAFEGFNPEVIAAYTEKNVTELLNNELIIRSRAKIVATIGNAQAYLKMAENGEDFSEYMWGKIGNQPIYLSGSVVPAKTPLSEEISLALKERGFKFVGPVIVYAWMQSVGLVNDHTPECYLYRKQEVGIFI